MGSENSTHSSNLSHSRGSVLGKPSTAAERKIQSSPRPSISSDSDVPYVSYCVNRPIGDSPKLSSKSPAHSLKTSTPSPCPSPKPRPKSYAGSSSTGHDIVVVKEGLLMTDALENDAEYIKLQAIPTFLPIMRGALNIPTVFDPEVLDKLDHRSLLQLCQRYQDHLKHCSEAVCSEQNALAGRIREIDFAISTLTSMLTERQKKFAKYAEQLGRVHEVSNALKGCQMMLTELQESMDTLNCYLPDDERLEAFAMVTG